jgi:hypothetical protein
MYTSRDWIEHFQENALKDRVNWTQPPEITPEEVAVILPSLQAWQLGETSDGRNLIRASTKYAETINDPHYIEAVRLFIKEEQKHGNNLGRYIDAIGQPRILRNWGDSLFRAVRYFNSSMEMWTLSVIVVESTAQIFYHALYEATKCPLLREICTDILIDEVDHITFQTDRLGVIFNQKTELGRSLRRRLYYLFFYATACVVWFAHSRLFKAGGHTFGSYIMRMRKKYYRTIDRITNTFVPMTDLAGW